MILLFVVVVVLILCLFFLSSRYHLKDVIVGKIYFLLVRIKIKHMEIQIIKRESTGTGTEINISIIYLIHCRGNTLRVSYQMCICHTLGTVFELHQSSENKQRYFRIIKKQNAYRPSYAV